MTRIIETERGSEIEVIAGSAVIKNAKVPNGIIVTAGQRYIYADIENNRLETFNAGEVLQSAEIQDFLESTKILPIPVGNPADAQYVVANLPDGQHLFCSQPEPKDWRSGAGVCFWFRKEGNLITGSFGYPNSDVFVPCVTGIINDNFMTGEALDISWLGNGWIEIPQETGGWDEDGHLKLGQGKIVLTDQNQWGRVDWIHFAFASLDLKGFYRYREENAKEFQAPKSCSVEDNLYDFFD